MNNMFFSKFSSLRFFSLNYWKNYLLRVKNAKNYKIDINTAIDVQNVNAYYLNFYAEKKQVIKNFFYKFEIGKIYCIIGNSGSGKSTLVSYFNGLMKSNTANIYLQKNKILFYKRKISNFKSLRREVGMVLQFPEHQLFKETVLKDVSYGPKILGFKKNSIEKLSIKQLLDFGITENLFNSNPFGLSGGQKRRVALAGIFVINPSIIIFDEPTAGLDPVSEQEIIDTIKELKRKDKTVIVISHNMDHVLEIADQVLVLNEGNLIDHGEPYKIFWNDHIIKNLNIVKPKIIALIDELIKKDYSFIELKNMQPKTIQEFAICLKKIIKKN